MPPDRPATVDVRDPKFVRIPPRAQATGYHLFLALDKAKTEYTLRIEKTFPGLIEALYGNNKVEVLSMDALLASAGVTWDQLNNLLSGVIVQVDGTTADGDPDKLVVVG